MHNSHTFWILVNIRLYQLKRYVAGLGPLYTSAVLLAICLASFVVYLQYHSFTRGLVCSSAILLVILFIQTHRSDYHFVFHNIERPSLNLFSEYFLFSFPFSIPALVTANWYFFPFMVVGISLISRVRIIAIKRTLLPNLSSLVPSDFFEWKSGMRKNAIQIGLVLILGLAFCWAKFFPLVFIWVFTGVVTSFYQECEPMHILIATSPKSSSKFLRSKLARHSILLLICFFPILTINTWLNPELVWLNLIFAVLQLSVLWFAILLKYSRYEPAQHLLSNSIPTSLASLSTVLPFLLPISLIMTIRYFRKGIKNIRTYLDD